MDKPAPASHALRDSAPTIPGSLQPQLLQPGTEAGISSSLAGDKTRAQSSQSFAEIIRNTQVGRSTTVLPHVALEGETLMFEARQEARYEQLKSLGSGAMGEVSLARDNDIGRKVAVKRLITHENQDQAGLLRFVEEIRTIGQLEHPNIVPIHDVGLDENGRYYFVMKYVDGETLEHVIDRLAAGDPDYHARFPVELRLEIFIGLLRALQYAHDQGIIHRDIKPANVMIGRYGEVVLMDWGIARKLRGDASPSAPSSGQQPTVKNPASSQPTEESRKRQFLTRNDHLIGTPAYMSPEQATGHNDKIDERSDIYSAAVVFHELLGLRHYLANHENLHSLLLAIASEPFPYMKLVFMRNPKFPVPRSEFLHFVARGLAKNPDDRFQSVIEMLGELQQIIDGRCHVRCPATLAKRSLREVAGFVDRFPKLSPFVFYSLVIFMFYSVGLTLYSLVR